jgi:hypothetical protein
MTEGKRVDRGGWVQVVSLGAHYAAIGKILANLEAAHDHGAHEAVRWHADGVLADSVHSRPVGAADSQAGKLWRRLAEHGV